MDRDSLINIMNPQPNNTVMIYDVHASESGALAILDDLYNQIKNYPDKSIHWIFVVSVPQYNELENITVRRFPWTKKNWGFRFYFDCVTTRNLIKEYKPDILFSLQNKGVPFFKGKQYVYLHLPSILTEHKFKISVDGKKLWLYQNVVSKNIFASLRKVNMTIVQTHWMKESLVKKAKLNSDRVIILPPDITTNNIGTFINTEENRRRFFYPATAFTYKNHYTLLKAIKIAKDRGLSDYEVILTIKPDESKYTQNLYKYAKENDLNIKFNGQVSRSQVFNLYTKSVLLFPSYVESFGLPLLEARLSGTYIIASDCSFCREILEGYEKARFFEELDAEKMADEILLIGDQL